jgi:hypothetical protein
MKLIIPRDPTGAYQMMKWLVENGHVKEFGYQVGGTNERPLLLAIRLIMMTEIEIERPDSRIITPSGMIVPFGGNGGP